MYRDTKLQTEDKHRSDSNQDTDYFAIVLPSANEVAGRQRFHRCMSVHGGGGGLVCFQ